MRVRPAFRETWSIVALLLALMMPLQSFAAEHCDLISGRFAADSNAQGAATAHQHCPQHERVPAPMRQHHGCCCDCCVAADLAAALAWTPPRIVPSELFLPAPRAPLTISLDRLDRPPRQFA